MEDNKNMRELTPDDMAKAAGGSNVFYDPLDFDPLDPLAWCKNLPGGNKSPHRWIRISDEEAGIGFDYCTGWKCIHCGQIKKEKIKKPAF